MRVPSLHALQAVYVAFHDPQHAQNLNADEIRYMYFLFVRIPRNLGSREIVKHVEYLTGIHRHNVLQRHHVAQVCYLSILIKDMTEPFFTFVIIACLEHSTFSTASLAFTH
jgi:hypothetical protein